MPHTVLVELRGDAADPKAAGAEIRERLDAAGLIAARIAAVRKTYDRHGSYPAEERTFDGEAIPAGSVGCR